MSKRVLAPEQIRQFLECGYVTLPDCFSREAAQALTDQAFTRLGYEKNDPATWQEARINMPSLEMFPASEFAPKAWQAACELVGGEERVEKWIWSDGFILNLREGSDRPWEAPAAKLRGWHKDGDFFRHFLDSPEQGLLTIVVWSDIATHGGGTFFAVDSVPVVARFFAEHPEGILPDDIPMRALIEQCREFVEFTGKVGDVVLMHPYMLHTVSQNHSGIPRFITNPPIMLKEPMQFSRNAPEEFSAVEVAVLRGLGVEKLDFQPTGQRERVVPERVRRQQQALEEQKMRLAQ